ncbi:hypothetical protein D9758_009494 [Tetrapyrgos nigripes]|uniref:Carrier domain-containing protein n=1 Tax=Tetrapyrgos nigripes TaxID=182062 RepID=A0A8H5LER0_9AGAR|nr:hypothetical protein D9758_009494 [Tetrapyrgos nigripes]
MIPSLIVHVPDFPLGTTGKVDRKLMSTIDFLNQRVTVTAKTDSQLPKHHDTPEESAILKIFSQALRISPSTLDRHNNFFEMGGHSLIAVQIVAAVRSHFGVLFTIKHFYNNATVAGVAASLSQCDSDADIPLKRLPDYQELFPASESQTRMWVEEQMNSGLSRNNVGFQRKLKGSLNLDALRNAFIALLSRHDALRTVLDMHEGDLVQRILSVDQCPPIAVLDYQLSSQCTPSELYEAEERARSFLMDEHAHPFDLGKDIPTRIAIVRVCPDLHFVSMIVHHVSSDGWSEGLIDQDLAILYNSFLTGVEPALDPLPFCYCDYSVWRKQKIQDSSLTAQLEYWTKQLEGARPLELFTDYQRPLKLSGRAAEHSFKIEAALVKSMRSLAAVNQTSLYVVLLAAFHATVYRLTGQEDGMIGMVNANRPRAELERIVGFFVNTHAIRLSVDPDTSFNEMIMQTSRVTVEALQHSEVPFDQVVARLAPQRDLSRNPLAQLMFVLQDFSGVVDQKHSHTLHGITTEEIRNATVRLDLSIHLFTNGNELHGYLMYQSDLFSSSTIQTVCDVFLRVIKTATQYPSSRLSTLPIIRAHDFEALSLKNADKKMAASQVSIGDRFREVAGQYSNSVAVVDGSSFLTYAMLDEQSDRLASWLVSRRLPSESIVGVHMHRSSLLAITYTGCLKAGLAYMPMDKALPLDRMRLMVQQAACRLVLTSEECDLGDDILTINLHEDKVMLSTPIVPLPAVSVHDLCNFMFTSGSTGVPKAVMVEHWGMLNLCAPETSNWPGRMKNALTTSIGFDPSGFQIFSTLLGGSELHCLPDCGIFDGEEYQNFIVDSGIERCGMTPSVLNVLLQSENDWLERSSLQHIMLGGEKLVPSDVAECIYIVDKDLAPVPAGVLGEIVVAGVNVARGYLNQLALTAERFVIPENSLLGDQRLYRTSDVGFWTSEGLLQFIGRKDTQLKVRGQRLEAGEVEAIIKHHSGVKSAAVVLIPTQIGDKLVAYIQLGADEEVREGGALSLWENQYNREDIYGELDDDVVGHDFARWVSMYTGEAIPVIEMEEWLDDAIAHIAPKSTDRVLELGVGTGKIAWNILERVTSFVGTDLSSVVVNFMSAQIARRGVSSRLSVFQAAAHEFDQTPKENPFTLAIINSVAQYFPSAGYFYQVIANILSVMPQGRIFIGDIRSYALVPYHDLERALSVLDDNSCIQDIRDTIQRYTDVQDEFLQSPAFFYDLRVRFPEIVHIEIEPKFMHHRNELSRYRYSATLHVGSPPVLVTSKDWIDCAMMESVATELRARLRNHDNAAFGAINIPVSDVQEVQKALELVKASNAPTSVQTLRQKLTDALATAEVTPGFVMQMAQEEGWNAILDFSSQQPIPSLCAIFTRITDVPVGKLVGDFPPLNSSESVPSYNVLAVKDAELVAGILSAVEKHLKDSLPAYMIPSPIIPVDELPLNRSGKLDRNMLASREYFEKYAGTSSSLPHVSGDLTNTERDVLAIFARALNRQADTIDIHEGLFNLGGHSLIATLIVAALRRELKTSLSMTNFFKHPTVKDTAAYIDTEEGRPSEGSMSLAETIGANATITVRNELSGPALFLFPETTGFASVYSSAFDYIPQKIVAFGDQNWGQDDTTKSITSTITSLIPAMRAVQPQGPYFLSGWSFGGYLALEAALQLEAVGESVGIVMMFDSSVNHYEREIGKERWYSELDPLLGITDKAHWLTQFRKCNRMVYEYDLRPGCFGGRVVLVKAERGRGGEEHLPSADPYNGWRKILPQVEVIGIDSVHRAMFDQTNGPEMGKIITGLLNEVEV